jgi:hypothetical protein
MIESNCNPVFTLSSKLSLCSPAANVAGIDVLNPISRNEDEYVTGSLIVIVTLADSSGTPEADELDVIRAIDTLSELLNRDADRSERLLDAVNIEFGDDYSWHTFGRNQYMVPLTFTGDYPADVPQDPDWWRSLVTVPATKQLAFAL